MSRFGQIWSCLLLAGLITWLPLRASAQDKPAAKPQIQIAILLDTSNSMDGLINQARTHLWKVVNEFASAKRGGQSPELHVALYEYGKSSLPAEGGFIRQVTPFTTDLDNVSKELFALTTNGGEEYCGWVIEKAVADLKWSDHAKDLKCIFIAGNEPFSQGPKDFRKSCKAAADKGITVSTIHCGDNSEGLRSGWAEGAKLADGTYVSINQNEVLPLVASPQDKELEQLSADLNKTYIPYGRADKRRELAVNQAAQDANASRSAPGAAQLRASVKASGLYRNAEWDLVDGLKEGVVKKLEDVKEEDLPEELKKLKPEERQAYVEKKAAERKDVQEKIKTLSQAREEHVNAELKKLRAGEGNTLDRAIIEAVRAQARTKEFEFAK
ncbi:vWA domain-containing protein [Anatilimnocola floriformis]|uniref:vWA domain-containing protein n=1 Tax=Anatilimnocola floriformis TaxID=2948575 RepID=UPI0020C1D820|nr:VWA domain-containing protein [Anatilimnocola floriformis]